MFKHILCSTDLNDASNQAVQTAVQMAHQYNAIITMLNVQEEFMTKDERGC